jgi:NAD(P)-dependent dehydrogenase (short-subunit alcohol dehydrogenase family)
MMHSAQVNAIGWATIGLLMPDCGVGVLSTALVYWHLPSGGRHRLRRHRGNAADGGGRPVATFNISRLAAYHMSQNTPKDDERGVIINTSSIAAYEGQIGQVAYTAAKAAIAGMCLTMARDLGSVGIRVLAIAPSLFLTGLTARVPEEMAAALVRAAAFPKRMGRPDEYAKLVAAIVENQMLNGQCIRLDAGQRFAPK